MSKEVNQNEWVGLTGAEIHDVWTHTHHPVQEEDVEQIAQLVEAKLREKNEVRETS